MSHLNFETGEIEGAGITSVLRTLADLAPIFADQEALAALPFDTPVYRTYGPPEPPDDAPAELLAATTVLYPGLVGREAFMTRGHFHVRPDRGETCLTLRGTGMLLLRDHAGRKERLPMTPGSLHMIDGTFAHRVANVGVEPLIFYVTWLSDCGHDYASVSQWPLGSWSVVL